MFNLNDVENALRLFDFERILEMDDGEEFGVVLDGQHHTATKLQGKLSGDDSYDRKCWVVVGIGDQFFRRDGYANSASYSYGDYDRIVWERLREVQPRVVPGVSYE